MGLVKVALARAVVLVELDKMMENFTYGISSNIINGRRAPS